MSFQTFEILDNNRGLINPPKVTNVATIPTRREDLLKLINENNFDPREEFYQKRSEAKAQLVQADRPDTYMEKAKSEFVDIALDPSIYADLERDARKRKDNYMNAESQDFVELVQQSVQSFNLESNLFNTTPPQQRGLVDALKQALGDKQSLSEQIINKLRADQKAKIKQTITRRRSQVPEYKSEL
jgi:uncharacterized membrane protein YccC